MGVTRSFISCGGHNDDAPFMCFLDYLIQSFTVIIRAQAHIDDVDIRFDGMFDAMNQGGSIAIAILVNNINRHDLRRRRYSRSPHSIAC